MAEIFGLIASIVTVIQLTEAVDKTVSKYLHTVKGVQSVLVPLLGRLRHLNAILNTLRLELETTNSLALQHLLEPLKICESLLSKLQSRLEHLKIIAGYIIGPVLDKDGLNQLKRLDDLIPVLQLALDVDTLTSTHAIEDYLHSLRLESQEQMQVLHRDIQVHHENARRWKDEVDQQRENAAKSQLMKQVLNWLNVVNPEANYLAACQQNQLGTGKWLLESKDFSDWEVGLNKCLWLNGMAGAGKTILCSTVIRHLIAEHGDKHIAYYFFDFKDTAKQDVESLLASLLMQVAGKFGSLPEPLLELFRRHQLRNPERPTPPTTDELMGVLVDVLNLQMTIFIVIDALDECKQIELLMETLCAILDQSESNCRFLLTSRAEIEIQSRLRKQDVKDLQIQNAAVDHDVAVYVRAILQTDDRLRAHRQGIKDLITITLTNGAKGMFRWVQCQVDRIRRLRTANEIKQALGELPPDLDQTYDNILISVQTDDRELLRKALQLILFSARPMHMREVAEAVIIKPGISEIDEDDRLQRPEDLLDIGKSLFARDHTIHPMAHFLELSHYSVKEYLLSERIKKGPAAAFAIDEVHAELSNATSLLTYLGLETFEERWQAFDAGIRESAGKEVLEPEVDFLTQDHEQRLEEYPLLLYAAQNCFRHHCRAESVQITVSSFVRDLFSAPNSGRFQNMTYTCVYNPLDPMASYERMFRYSLIGIAAQYNLLIIVQDLLAAGIPTDYLPPKPKWIEPYLEGQTALCRAADFGHENLCKILIDAGANVQGTASYDCPLSAASRSGKPAIVRMMLDAGADVMKDARPLSKTQLAIWWRYVDEKNNSKWRDILDILRDAGGRWSTIGLFSAFSKSAKPLIKYATEVLQDDSIDDTQSDESKCIVDKMDTYTLNALQWLAQDETGTAGFKASLETLLRATYESQPHLFTQDPRLVTQKFSAEEVIAENLIYIYFRPIREVFNDPVTQTVDQRSDIVLNALYIYFRPIREVFNDPSTQTVDQRSDILLNALWGNVTRTMFPAGISREPIEADASMRGLLHRKESDWPDQNEGLTICGDILRVWTRARWKDSYADFFH